MGQINKMKKSEKNRSNNQQPFLKRKFKIDEIEKDHKELLGLTIPDGYFQTSKTEILEKVTSRKGSIINFTRTKRRVLLPIAAAVALLITLTVFELNPLDSFKNVPSIVSDTINEIKDKHLANSNSVDLFNDVSLASLFVEDEELDDFVDAYVIDQIILKESVIK